MAIIQNLEQLKKVLSAGEEISKAMNEPVSPASSGTDWLGRFENIINGIVKISENIKQQKGQQESKPQRIIESTDYRVSDVPQKPQSPPVKKAQIPAENPAQNDNKNEGGKMLEQIIKYTYQYLVKCHQENPNMTLAEAIDKIPINVTQAAGLLEIYIKSKGG